MTLQLNPQKTALVVIDLQKGIVGLPGKPNNNQDVILNASMLVKAFRKAGSMVILVRVDFHDGQDALKPITDQTPSKGMGRPEEWATIIPELGPEPEDIIVTKRQWGAFFGTELDLQLRRRGIDTIVMCGISTNIGVETTAREAFQRNYQQIFAVDAMNALSKTEHNHTCEYIFPRMGRIRSTDEILHALS